MLGPSLLSVFKSDLERHTNAIIEDDFSQPQADMATWKEALDRILEESEVAGINAELPKTVSLMLAHGIEQGLGKEELSAVVKVMS